MEKFVGAVKEWVRFELFLSIVGMIGVVIFWIVYGQDVPAGLNLLMGILFMVLIYRLGLLIAIVKAPEETDYPSDDAVPDLR